jgi:hypothetical protein
MHGSVINLLPDEKHLFAVRAVKNQIQVIRHHLSTLPEQESRSDPQLPTDPHL